MCDLFHTVRWLVFRIFFQTLGNEHTQSRKSELHISFINLRCIWQVYFSGITGFVFASPFESTCENESRVCISFSQVMLIIHYNQVNWCDQFRSSPIGLIYISFLQWGGSQSKQFSSRTFFFVFGKLGPRFTVLLILFIIQPFMFLIWWL